MRLLSPIYQLFEFFSGSGSSNKVPIFIIGAPRSGSTLLYQSMVSYFDIGYFNNYHHKNFHCPSLAELRKRSLNELHTSDFKSKHGEVDGDFAPSECWDFWYRFFRKNPHYTEIQDIDSQQLKRLKFALRSFINIADKNILVKNLPCVTRIQPLLRVFPDAYWIVINRNYLDNALSIAKMRLDSSQDLNKWDSVQPKGYEKYLESPYEVQIFKQIELINKTIISDLEGHKSRVSIIEYDELCDSPISTFEKLKKRMEDVGIVIQKNEVDIPDSFKQKKNSMFESDYSKTILEYYESNKNQLDSLNSRMSRIFTE